jgi:hypothetical protein
MTRLTLYNTVKTVCPTYWVGQHSGECLSTYAVIKYKNQSKSIGNGGAGWQYIDVMVYTPSTSISGVDDTLASIKAVLTSIGLEPTGNMTPDYLDTEKKAIMRSEEYRLPKQI